jgi:hexosaminidase
MPGHGTAATVSYPEIACEGKSAAEICVGKEKTFEFMANVLDEVAEMFPSPFIHIGGDEVQSERWRACPVCKKKMDELAAAGLPEGVEVNRVTGTKAGQPFFEDISRLHGDFVRRIDKHLAAKGKRMIGWDEILDSGLGKDSRAIVGAWRSPAAVTGAVRQGHDVIVSIYPDCYLDNGISLAQTYAFEPTPSELTPGQTARILGMECNMWGERTPTQQSVDQQTFPRLCALAEVGWTPRESRNFEDFIARLRQHAEAMRKYGIILFPK